MLAAAIVLIYGVYLSISYSLGCGPFGHEGFPFDRHKIQGAWDVWNVETLVAPIVNQVWVTAYPPDEKRLREIVATFPELQVIGYSTTHDGLLVQFDDTKYSAPTIINKLVPHVGGDYVYSRMFEGCMAQRNN